MQGYRWGRHDHRGQMGGKFSRFYRGEKPEPRARLKLRRQEEADTSHPER
jgi:hypothetical protein